MRARPIDVNIDELIVDGLPPGAEVRFKEAFVRELTRLFETRESISSPPATARDDSPEAIGRRLAAIVHARCSQ